MFLFRYDGQAGDASQQARLQVGTLHHVETVRYGSSLGQGYIPHRGVANLGVVHESHII